MVARNPVRLRWAAALAALAGGLGGPFFVYWPATFNLASSGEAPLLAGDAATAAQVGLALVVGAVVAGVATLLIGKNGHEALAGVVGVVASVVALGFVAEAAAPLAQDWVNWFAARPGWGALVGGAIAGGLAGSACGAMLAARPAPTAGERPTAFSAVVGSVGGLLAGAGGGQIGLDFALMTTVCPNGYYSNPMVPAGECPVGIGVTGLLVGAWAGAIAGAALGGLVFTFLRRPQVEGP